MDWSKDNSYDRFLDIHLINKNKYDFYLDVKKQYDYQQKEIQKVIDDPTAHYNNPANYHNNPTNYMSKRLLPSKSEWKKMSYVGVFAGRSNETEAIDILLDKFHRSFSSSEQFMYLDMILIQVNNYLARKERGARWAAYNDLLLTINRIYDRNLSIPVALDSFICFPVKKDDPKIKNLRTFPLRDITDKLYDKQKKSVNGYLSVFVEINDVKKRSTHANYDAILAWVSEYGRLGKVRFNCHGDGKGHLTMGDSSWCDGEDVVSWMVNNGYFNHCVSVNYNSKFDNAGEASRKHIHPINSNNTNPITYAGTISVAACMAGREKLDLSKNLTSYHTSQLAVAHDNSLISCIARNLDLKKLPVIKITGAHEVVKNTDSGMQRSFKIGYFCQKDKKLTKYITKIGNIYRLKIDIDKTEVTLYQSVSGSVLRFSSKFKLRRTGFLDTGSCIELMIERDPKKFWVWSFDSEVYSIYKAGDEVHIAPPHGFTFIEENNEIYIASEHAINSTGDVKIRLAHSDSKLAVFTKGF